MDIFRTIIFGGDLYTWATLGKDLHVIKRENATKFVKKYSS